MSDSRLEKFIYAICSMDVSDLPVPLSRIEKLWNCLITGETPDFEPLSRNEKYLMAMLDRYDISNLPAPMSRGEKLLYKIAVGETDLSDVPGYLSRYEELLKYLIENGGIGFEYILYTLNQSLSTLYTTAEKPVKSAILTGNTLINEALTDFIQTNNKASINDTTITLDLSTQYSGVNFLKTNPFFEPNQTYTAILYDIVGDTTNIVFSIQNAASTRMYLSECGYKFKFLMGRGNELTNRLCYIENIVSTSGTVSFKIVLLKGDYTNTDIPYFTGMQSVKLPVLTTTNNLFNYQNKESNCYYVHANGTKENNGEVDSYCVEVLENNKYELRCVGRKSISNITYWDSNMNFISGESEFSDTNYRILTTPSLCRYVKFPLHHTGITYVVMSDKTNILSTPEDLELRGVGDVKDELNLMTGELTQRIEEIVLNGSESWASQTDSNWNNDTHISFRFKIKNMSINGWGSGKSNCISDKFKTKLLNNDSYIEAEEFIGSDGHAIGTMNFNIKLLRSRLNGNETVDGFKQWLSQNPITVQYQLKTPTIKTVDLTTVDQDGQPTKLKTFNDITYVEINADSIIPSVDMEVATKISETLATLDPQQLDISDTQNKLSQTIDEQSENTDATMMATTEIYEQTL